MRIQEIRISGFRSAPVAVQMEAAIGTRGKSVSLAWADDAVCVRLPVASGPRQSMLSAIMGANSAGKSTVLLALYYFFGAAVKLDEALYYGKHTDQPIVMQVTLVGAIAQPTAWHQMNCTQAGKQANTLSDGKGGEQWSLIVASVWTPEQRVRLVQRGDGCYYRQTPRDRAECERLFPEWRVIWADRGLQQEASLERKSLLSDLVDALLAQATQGNGVVARMAALVDELVQLVAQRELAECGDDWTAIRTLEAKLAQGLAAITPEQKRVRLNFADALPSLRAIFAQSVLQIDDGVPLALEQHGLGMQRSLVVSILRTWCDYIRNSGRDYLFAIEEPEIYLHPHATRVLLNLLEEIASHDQVIFTTHASEFVNRVPLSNIVTVARRQRAGASASYVLQPQFAALPPDALVKVQRYLQEDRSDMLFARAVILVEGQAEYFALPAFARTLGLDFDAAGVSTVFVNGIGNFGTYHQILAAFAIPHVIVMDGDGQQAVRQRSHAGLADALFVLPQDFEQLLVQALSPMRLLTLMNECLARRGKPARNHLGAPRRRVEELAGLGKPLVGRVAGETLTPAEIGQMGLIAQALQRALHLARREME